MTMFNANENEILTTNSSQLINVRIPTSLCDNSNDQLTYGYNFLDEPGPLGTSSNLNLIPDSFFSLYDPMTLNHLDASRVSTPTVFVDDNHVKRLVADENNALESSVPVVDSVTSDEDEVMAFRENSQRKNLFATKSKPKCVKDVSSLPSSSDEDELDSNSQPTIPSSNHTHESESNSVKARLLEFLTRRSLKSSNSPISPSSTSFSKLYGTVLDDDRFNLHYESETSDLFLKKLPESEPRTHLDSFENVYPTYQQTSNESLIDQMLHDILGVPAENNSLLRNRSTADLFKTLYLQVTDSKSKRKSYNFKPDKVYQPVEETEFEEAETENSRLPGKSDHECKFTRNF